MAKPLALGVLVSGTGTNLGAILDAIAEGRLDAEVRVVISNKPGVLALERAEKAGVRALCVPHKEFATRDAFDAELVRILREAGATWIVLAGFMRLVTGTLLGAYPDRVVNIHPALLPAFPGVDAQAQALDYGVKITGCTVHLVDEGTDTGPVIAQRAVPVLPTDDRDALQRRILDEEHALLVEVLDAIGRGRLECTAAGDGRRRRARLLPA